jgi:hypothetical protein
MVQGMNASLRQEVLTLREATPQTSLPLAAEGVQRYVWEHRFGSMLIEVDGDEVRVNGELVQPAQPQPPQAQGG